MEENFLPFKESLNLDKLGFDRSCLGWYDSERSALSVGEGWRSGQNSINAPLYQQAFRWFRTKYDLHLMADDVYYDGIYSYAFQISSKGIMICGTTPSSDYEEAELACLNKLIEIAQKEK